MVKTVYTVRYNAKVLKLAIPLVYAMSNPTRANNLYAYVSLKGLMDSTGWGLRKKQAVVSFHCHHTSYITSRVNTSIMMAGGPSAAECSSREPTKPSSPINN